MTQRIAVFLPNWIGDVVMATPALEALRRHFGQEAKFAGVMRPYVSQVLSGTSWLDDELHYDPKNRGADLGSWSLVKRLRAWRPEMVVLLIVAAAMLAIHVGIKKYGSAKIQS